MSTPPLRLAAQAVALAVRATLRAHGVVEAKLQQDNTVGVTLTFAAAADIRTVLAALATALGSAARDVPVLFRVRAAHVCMALDRCALAVHATLEAAQLARPLRAARVPDLRESGMESEGVLPGRTASARDAAKVLYGAIPRVAGNDTPCNLGVRWTEDERGATLELCGYTCVHVALAGERTPLQDLLDAHPGLGVRFAVRSRDGVVCELRAATTRGNERK